MGEGSVTTQTIFLTLYFIFNPGGQNERSDIQLLLVRIKDINNVTIF